MRIITAAAAAAAVFTGTAAWAAMQPTQVHLLEQNGSGETGTATMLQGERGLIVKLRMSSAGDADQPAHIHIGTCAKLDPKPTYPLKLVRNGQSETTIPNVSLADLQKGSYAINVHKSVKESAIYVSCGNIGATK
jgi:hypothetical protein